MNGEYARRGDVVEAWIKRSRDCWASDDPGWTALDYLLDDYRGHADTGTPLTEDVQGPHGDED
jgi:hypothetical protein